MCNHCKDFCAILKEPQYCAYCGELLDPLAPLKQALWCCVTTEPFTEANCTQCLYKDRNPCPAECDPDFAKDILEVLKWKTIL